MADKEAIIRALQEAMTMDRTGRVPYPRKNAGGGPSEKAISDAEREKIRGMRGMMGASGKTLSDADRMKMQEIRGRGDMDLSPEQIKMLEQMMKQQQGVRDAEERKAFPPDSMMNRGGEVQGYKPGGVVTKKTKKPKMGCVMKGRGGSYKGRS